MTSTIVVATANEVISLSGTLASGGMNNVTFTAVPAGGGAPVVLGTLSQPDGPFTLPPITEPAGPYTIEAVNTATITSTVNIA